MSCPLLGNERKTRDPSTNTRAVARQHPLLTRHKTIEDLLAAVFSMQSDQRLYNLFETEARQSNCNSFTDLHTSQIITAHAKSQSVIVSQGASSNLAVSQAS
jgi:hypothetical protein